MQRQNANAVAAPATIVNVKIAAKTIALATNAPTTKPAATTAMLKKKRAAALRSN